jgi:hypothetical protein
LIIYNLRSFAAPVWVPESLGDQLLLAFFLFLRLLTFKEANVRIRICLLIAFLLIGNVLYAANGDLLVTGNAGIGTTAPKGKLDVKGPAIVDSVIESMGYVDLAKGVTPTISSGSFGTGGPTFRGMWTYWFIPSQQTSPQSYPASLVLDLYNSGSSETDIRYICFGSSWRTGQTGPSSYTIDYSIDGTNWTNLVAVQNNASAYVTHNVGNNINPLARYIRITVLAPQTPVSDVYIAGLRVFAVEGPSMYGENPWSPRVDDAIFAMPGNVGIGTISPAYKLDVAGTIASNGSPITSDVRFKKNIEPVTDALEKVLGLNGVTYEWKTEEYADKGFDKGRHYGVIAQEIEKVLPEVVKTRQDGSKNVAYTEIIPVLIEAIKAQQKRIEQLQTEVDDLRNRNRH